jgi:acyl-CoA synthetase (AMP-forming)/AMP-acid ligase II
VLVSSIVRRNAAFFGDRDAIVEPGRRTLSWTVLDDRTNQLARGLLSLGVAKGDRIAVLAPNCAEHIELFFAEAKSGIVGAPINIRLTLDEWVAYCRYVEPAAVVIHASLAGAADLADRVPSIRHLIGFGGDHGLPIDLDELAAAQPLSEPDVSVDENDLYQLAATSGTTGVSKAAALTHRNAWAAICMYLAELNIVEGETVLQNIPLFFNPGGPAHIHPALVKGGRTIILPSFDPGAFCDAVMRYRVNHTILVPTMVTMVLDHPATATTDFSSLRSVISGGSPVSRDLLLRARPVFGDVFFPQFGMAETYSSGLILRREHQITEGPDEIVRRLGSAGTPHVSIEVRVVAADGTDVPRDNTSEGEIWLRGDSVADQYFRMPDETAASHEGDWFKTGDIGVMDAGGFITVVDRAKDVIITGGINVHGREVEEVLLTHPAIAAAAVIGIPHPTWGEQVHAVVVPTADATVDERDVLAHCAERLAGYKKPRSLSVVDELPMTATGKVRKRELRERFGAGR